MWPILALNLWSFCPDSRVQGLEAGITTPSPGFYFLDNDLITVLVFKREKRHKMYCIIHGWFLCFVLFCFWNKYSLCSPGWYRTHSIDQASLQLTEIYLPLVPRHWDQRHKPRCLVNYPLLSVPWCYMNFSVEQLLPCLRSSVHDATSTFCAQYTRCSFPFLPSSWRPPFCSL